MKINFIAAMSENRIIGNQGKLPWHLPNDLKYFKKLTMGKHILMGRKTFASIGKALPGRHNIVLTKDRNFFAPDIKIFNNQEDFLFKQPKNIEIMIIGGSEIFSLFLPYCHIIYLTLVHTVIEGDASFPDLSNNFIEIERENHDADNKHAYKYSFIKLRRCRS